MNRRTIGVRVLRAGTVLLGVWLTACPAGRAVTYTWTNTAPDAVDYWTNGANWNQAGNVPGNGATVDNAYFTRNVDNAYTGILDSALALPLNALTISNNLGTARLVVQQGAAPVTLTVNNLTLGDGGWLQIDTGGTVNLTNNMAGTGSNRVLCINGGGTFLYPGFTNFYGLGAAGAGTLVTSTEAPGAGGVWDFRTNALNFGFNLDSNAITLNNVTVTNAWLAWGVTANGSSLTLTNHATIVGVTNFDREYMGAGGSNNVLTVSTGCVWNFNAGFSVGSSYSSRAPCNNRLLVDGGTLTNLGWGGYGLLVGSVTSATGNTVVVTNGGTIVSTGLNLTVGATAGAGANSFTLNGGTVSGFKGLTIGANGGSGSSVTIANGSMLMNGLGTAGVGSNSGTNNALYVYAGGLWQNGPTAASGITIGGGGATSNLLWVDSGTVSGLNVAVGYQLTAGGGNQVVITNGGQIYFATDSDVGSLPGVGNNQAVVTGTGSLWSVFGTNAGAVRVGYSGNGGNTLRVERGGQIVGGADNATIGYRSTNNAAFVTSGGSWTNGGFFEVGLNGGVSNQFVVDGGTILGSRVYVGYADTAAGNRLIVTNGGQVLLNDRAYACGNGPSNCFDNVIQLSAGGLLEANTLYVNGSTITGPVSGNMITNSGGIYQFTNATPTITLASNGWVYLTGGTISFRAITNADVFCNQAGKPLDSSAKMAWDGDNAFRLNKATNLVTASQTYTFDTGSATNFVRLEMVSGGTRYRGQAGNALRIGTNGQMLCSNTAAAVDLPFTNDGTLTLVKSTLAFGSNATLNGTLAIDLDHLAATNGLLAANNLTLGGSSVLALSGAGTNLDLLTYSGTRTGQFHTVTGLPPDYRIRDVSGRISLERSTLGGSIIVVR